VVSALALPSQNLLLKPMEEKYMPGAVLTKAALFISAFLLAFEIILTGCAPMVPPEILDAEDRIASGRTLDSTKSLDLKLSAPDMIARRKILLIVDSIINEEYSTAETKSALKGIQDDPEVSRDIKIDAGYLLSMVDKIDSRNKDIERLQNKNSRLVGERNDAERALKDKDARIDELVTANEELQFKLKKLEETYQKAEKRRGIRK